MNFNKNTDLDKIMKALFEPYKESVTDVKKVTEALVERKVIAHEDEIVNDHIAFRTLGVPHLGIASFEKIFLHHGYEKRDFYDFKEKKLNAYWYAPPHPNYPRIFISELRVAELSEKSQQLIGAYTKDIKQDPVDNLDLNNSKEVGEFFYNPLWSLASVADYLALSKESEYAAWVIYNRYYLNHYTISVHDLKEGYNTLVEFNKFLKDIGIRLNDSGGVIKVSKDGLLKQSSSVAKLMKARFAGNESIEIPGSYVEFAERLPLPNNDKASKGNIANSQRRDGFESANADKIFESTYTSQTN